MSRNVVLVLAALVLAASSVAQADTIVGSGSWQTWPVVNENGYPYWDQQSLDGSQKNIGYQLISMGLTPQYWGTGGGNPDMNFYFTQTGVNNTSTLLLEIASNSGINEFGWYEVGNPSNKNVLFSGSSSPVTSVVFDPTSNYGFYLNSGNYTYYTQSSLNTGGENIYQHFAVFALDLTPGSEIYYIGVEDLPKADRGIEKLGDFNDMIVKVQSNPIPEPSTYLLCASALLGVGLWRRRRTS